MEGIMAMLRTVIPANTEIVWGGGGHYSGGRDNII